MEILLDVSPEEAVTAVQNYFKATHVNVELDSVKAFEPVIYPDVIAYLVQWSIPGYISTGEEIPFRREDGVVKIIKNSL